MVGNMGRKAMVGGGAAAVLSLGVLLGGVTMGLASAQTPPTPAPAQSSSTATPETPDANAEASGDSGADVAQTAPAGSISSAQAQQDAAAYIAQTAPYSSQGLTAGTVTVNDENGTIVYSVDFSNGTQSDVQVNVSTQGTVLSADTGADTEAAGAETDGAPGTPDSPTGHADAAGAAGTTAGSQQN